MREYVATGSAGRASRRAKRRLLKPFQELYEELNPGHTILESLRNSVFLQDWLFHVRLLSAATVRGRLGCLKGFTRWLFDQGRVDDNVLAYVDVSRAAEHREIPAIVLQDNLQREIAGFEATLLNYSGPQILDNMLSSIRDIYGQHGEVQERTPT